MIFKHIIDFIFPNTCIACKKYLESADSPLCEACKGGITFIKDHLFCGKCGKMLPYGGKYCYQCANITRAYSFEVIRAACVYDGSIKQCIHQFKYSRKDYLDAFLGRLFFENIRSYTELDECEAIMPVPLHWWKQFKRGYNQSELLAVQLSQILKKPLFTKVLYRKRYTKPQFNLKQEERHFNIKDAFAVKNQLLVKGKKIVLIDDVSTTNGTLDECSRVLKEAGAKSVSGFVLARE